ncbi:MAG: hypothetical protein OEX19_06380 [Gammaproteobacteria bacterium]|nr:hypothetical protein [Gammaproteobacteria bacterium]
MKKQISLILCALLSLPLIGLSGCNLDILSSKDKCPAAFDMSGVIDDININTDYLYNVTWFNSSAEEEAIGNAEKLVMTALGLDIADVDDIARFKYFTENYELSLSFIEPNTDDTVFDELDFEHFGTEDIRKDYAVYIFDLEDQKYQPGTPIEVFDFSALSQTTLEIDWGAVKDAVENAAINTANDVADTIGGIFANRKIQSRAGLTNADEIADLFRELVDDMRSNNKPDAIIGFNLDRSADQTASLGLVNLFSPKTIFANSGTVKLTQAKDIKNKTIDTIKYPITDVHKISFTVNGDFDDHGNVQTDASCLRVDIANADE